jgi:hypothetical protein
VRAQILDPPTEEIELSGDLFFNCVESTAGQRKSYAVARPPILLLAISFAKHLELIVIAMDRALLNAVRHFNSPSGHS